MSAELSQGWNLKTTALVDKLLILANEWENEINLYEFRGYYVNKEMSERSGNFYDYVNENFFNN